MQLLVPGCISGKQTAGHEQTLDDADMLGAQFGPTEHPVFSAQRNDPQRPFQVVRVDRDIGVLQIDRQAGASLADVGKRLREGAAWQETLRLEVVVDPFEEAFGYGFGMGLTQGGNTPMPWCPQGVTTSAR